MTHAAAELASLAAKLPPSDRLELVETILATLDKSGQIYEVNTVDWSIRDAGFLPVPHSLFSDGQQDGASLIPARRPCPICALPLK